MLNQNAEWKIRNYLEISIDNGYAMLSKFLETGKWKFLELAQNELSHASCYWNIYHATTTNESFDDSLWKSFCGFRETVEKHTPTGA